MADEHPPFIVFALPRSRTAWLSRYLSYGEWFCGHDELRRMRSLDDVQAWLSQPCTGSAETAAASWWRLALHYRPDLRVLVVRRPVIEVIDSLERGGMVFDEAKMTRAMEGINSKLDQIARRFPGAVEVDFADLAHEDTCARVFEHCLPYKFDPAWWQHLSPINIQVSLRVVGRYVAANRPRIEKLANMATQKTRSLILARRPVVSNGVTLQEEPFEVFYRDAEELGRDHLVATDQDTEEYKRKNIPLMRRLAESCQLQVVTARANGRLFGYLMTAIFPSLDSPDVLSAWHTTFFASPDIPGLGLRLQRESVRLLREKGIAGEVILRAGTRGSGPRLGSMYKRMGAEDFGTLYRLNLKDS